MPFGKPKIARREYDLPDPTKPTVVTKVWETEEERVEREAFMRLKSAATNAEKLTGKSKTEYRMQLTGFLEQNWPITIQELKRTYGDIIARGRARAQALKRQFRAGVNEFRNAPLSELQKLDIWVLWTSALMAHESGVGAILEIQNNPGMADGDVISRLIYGYMKVGPHGKAAPITPFHIGRAEQLLLKLRPDIHVQLLREAATDFWGRARQDWNNRNHTRPQVTDLKLTCEILPTDTKLLSDPVAREQMKLYNSTPVITADQKRSKLGISEVVWDLMETKSLSYMFHTGTTDSYGIKYEKARKILRRAFSYAFAANQLESDWIKNVVKWVGNKYLKPEDVEKIRKSVISMRKGPSVEGEGVM